MGSVWVVNASPLISLGRVGRIDLLPQLCDQMIIPEGVAREIEEGPPDDPARLWMHERGSQFVGEPAAIEPIIGTWDLGPGESQVLSLCLRTPGREAILDDRSARRCATALGIPLRGTFAVIVLAKHRALLPAARPILEELMARGLRAHAAVFADALRLAGE